MFLVGLDGSSHDRLKLICLFSTQKREMERKKIVIFNELENDELDFPVMFMEKTGKDTWFTKRCNYDDFVRDKMTKKFGHAYHQRGLYDPPSDLDYSVGDRRCD
jgi:hypothetical protein